MTELWDCARDFCVIVRRRQQTLPWHRGGRLRWAWLWMRYGRQERRHVRHWQQTGKLPGEAVD